MKKQSYDEKERTELHITWRLLFAGFGNQWVRTYIWEVWNNAKTVFEGTQECQVSISGTDRETDGAFESGRQRSKRKSWDTGGADGWTVGSDGRIEDAGSDGMGEKDE